MESPNETSLPIATTLSSPPRHNSLAPSISAYINSDSGWTTGNELELISSRDSARNSEGPEENLEEGRQDAEGPLFVANQEVDLSLPSNVQARQQAGVSENFFGTENRFSPLPAREGSHFDAGDLRSSDAGEDQEGDDQVSSYNAIASEDAEEEEPPREARALTSAPSYNLMRIEGAHFNGKEFLPPHPHP